MVPALYLRERASNRELTTDMATMTAMIRQSKNEIVREYRTIPITVATISG